MILALRSLLFNTSVLIWTAILSVLLLPCLALPRHNMQSAARFWIRGILLLAKGLCGLGHRVKGLDNLPSGPVVIAAKHQSMWDTMIFHHLCPDPVYVLKKELLGLPIIGWYLRKAGNIGIDRSAGFRAIKMMLPAVDRRLKEGAQVVIFPEGTRGAPGIRHPYHPGVAAIYARARLPVVPVALNSGLFWGRKRFFKFPGVITIEFLPPLPDDLNRAAFLNELQERIEQATERLIREGTSGGSNPPAHAIKQAS